MKSSSRLVTHCQICNSNDLKDVLFLGYLPPVNKMHPIGTSPGEEQSYAAQLLLCRNCELVQLGLAVDPAILFPKEYPYTSSTTKLLRDNFAELYSECITLFPISKNDLVIDIGSNDGNLLSNFQRSHRVLGVTPEDIGHIAIERGIPTIQSYFTKELAAGIVAKEGQAKIITATNVFAHIDSIHAIVEAILDLLTEDGIFISESHYLLPLLETLQYDTIYHEHLRYYSLKSLTKLFDNHGLEVIHVKQIPTHGGSIRVYTSRKGTHPINDSVQRQIELENRFGVGLARLTRFRDDVIASKLKLTKLIAEIKLSDGRISGVSAPSRASTLIHYTGLDDGLLDNVVEVSGSHKIGKYMPGTLIPVVDEEFIFGPDQPSHVLMLSWHIAEELMPKLALKGYKGKFIIPLPNPQIISL